ncbi:MAG TPA: PAS domain S-box protein [Burkholderiales bacterium]|nr:PAS domain S-box protein [Burkholderiales bacterium]
MRSSDQNDALNAALVAQSPDAIILSDREGNIEVWNAAAERIFGHRADEVLGRSLDVIIPERLRAAHWAGFDAALASGREKYAGRVLTTRSMHKDGSKLYVDLAFALIRDAAGAVTGVVATARDCTARYEEERALRARVAQLEAGKGGSP